MNDRSSVDIADRKREVNREKADKKVRVPLYEQKSLDFFDKEDGFVYRYVNDLYGRIAAFQRAGWEIVEGDVCSTFAGKGREIEQQRNSQVWRVVNNDKNAPCKDAVLMRIPVDLYQLDQAAKTKQVLDAEKAMDPTGKIRSARKFGGAGNHLGE